MKGNQILVSVRNEGHRIEGIIDNASKPGAIMQVVAQSADVNGRYHYVEAATGTDGKCASLYILLDDNLQGKLPTDAYTAGTIGFLYAIQPGDEANVLLGEVAGTGNSYNIGDRLILDAEDGVLVPESGSPQTTIAICMEKVTQQAGSTLTWVRFF